MKQRDGGYPPSHNRQISTDAKQTIIVAAEVSQSGSDYEELVPATLHDWKIACSRFIRQETPPLVVPPPCSAM